MTLQLIGKRIRQNARSGTQVSKTRVLNARTYRRNMLRKIHCSSQNQTYPQIWGTNKTTDMGMSPYVSWQQRMVACIDEGRTMRTLKAASPIPIGLCSSDQSEFNSFLIVTKMDGQRQMYSHRYIHRFLGFLSPFCN